MTAILLFAESRVQNNVNNTKQSIIRVAHARCIHFALSLPDFSTSQSAGILSLPWWCTTYYLTHQIHARILLLRELLIISLDHFRTQRKQWYANILFLETCICTKHNFDCHKLIYTSVRGHCSVAYLWYSMESEIQMPCMWRHLLIITKNNTRFVVCHLFVLQSRCNGFPK